MRNCETNTFQVVKGVGLDKRCEYAYVYDEHKNEENYELKIKAIKWNMYVISHAQQHTAQKNEFKPKNTGIKKTWTKRKDFRRDEHIHGNQSSHTTKKWNEAHIQQYSKCWLIF